MRTRVVTAAVGLLMVGFIGGDVPAHADGGQPQAEVPPVWLGLASPAEGSALIESVPFVEVVGRAGALRGGHQDVVIALDVSGSTLAAAGVDVDGDGEITGDAACVPVGQDASLAEASAWPRDAGCEVLGDTVQAAEIAAARELVDLLDPELTRVALVTFSGRARLAIPLMRPDGAVQVELLAADSARSDPQAGTDFRAAIAAALDAFDRADATSPVEAQRTILLLSDGQPIRSWRFWRAPGHGAIEQAERAARAGVRIHTFALGIGAGQQTDLYARIAATTGGRFTRVPEPAGIIDALPRVDLADVAAISMVNLTTGGSGRAIRVFPDGSFDGFLPLAPGDNHLRITAQSASGAEVAVDRSVRFEAGSTGTAAERVRQREEQDRLMETLRTRTAQMRQIVRIERAREQRAGQERHLELCPEDAVPASPAP